MGLVPLCNTEPTQICGIHNALLVGEPVKDILHIPRDPIKPRNAVHKAGCSQAFKPTSRESFVYRAIVILQRTRKRHKQNLLCLWRYNQHTNNEHMEDKSHTVQTHHLSHSVALKVNTWGSN